MSKVKQYNSHINYGNLTVNFNVSHDPGVWTFPNGDPGYPASTELSIESIKNEKGIEVSDEDVSKEEMEEIEQLCMQDYENYEGPDL